MRYLHILLLLAVFCACTKHPQDIQTGSQTGFSEKNVRQGMVRVKLKPRAARSMAVLQSADGVSTGVAELDRIAGQLGATRVERSFAGSGEHEWKAVEAGLDLWYDIYFDEEVPVSRAFSDFSQSDDIDIVEPDYRIERTGDMSFVLFDEAAYASSRLLSGSRADFPVNDPFLNEQWNFYNEGDFEGSVAGADINLFQAWNTTAGSRDVIVAIVDGGIQADHEDLNANMWKNASGHYGWNYVDNSATLVPHMHGTHVAGMVAAVNNNGRGVAGIAGGSGNGDGVRLMSCQIYKPDPNDPDKDISSSRVHEAIRYGADNGAVISQNSWGYAWQDKSQPPPGLAQIHKEAIDYFIRYAGTNGQGVQTGPMNGGIVIFAAGNDDTEYKTYPAAYEKVISVAGFAADYKKGYYSNYGDWVMMSAPGGDYTKGGNDEELVKRHLILSTGQGIEGRTYAYMQGTSMACPHISGVAALIVSHAGGPGFTPDDLKEILLSSCKDLDVYQAEAYRGKMGAGAIDAALAFYRNNGMPPEEVTDLDTESHSRWVDLKWSVTADQDNVKAYRYDIYMSGDELQDDEDLVGLAPSRSVYTGLKRVGEQIGATIDYLDPETLYYFAVIGVDVFGNASGAAFVSETTQEESPLDFAQNPSVVMTLKNYETGRYGFRVAERDGITWSVSDVAYKGATILPAEAVYTEKRSGENQVFDLVIKAAMLDAGDYQAHITVTDKYGKFVKKTFDFTVLANSVPELYDALPDMYFNALGSLQNLTLTDYFRDADGEMLSYSIVSDIGGIIETTVDGVGVAKITAVKSGKAVVEVKATDFMGAVATGTFTLYSRDGNQAVEVYPNPVIDKVNLRVGPGDDQTLRVVVYSNTGKVVVDKNVTVVAYEASQLDLSGLQPGSYNMVITMRGKEVKRTIVKL